MRVRFTSFVVLLLGMASFSASSQLILNPCSNSAVTLNSVTTLTGEEQLFSGPYDASDCVGVYLGNDRTRRLAGAREPGNNMGELNDGLLNGAGKVFTGMEFIEEGDLQDLDGDGNATDPGWIKLGTAKSKRRRGANSLGDVVKYNTVGTGAEQLDIADLLKIDIDCDGRRGCTSGSWRIETLPDIIEEVQALLGPATFDHLALSFNTKTFGLGRFAVYDFNFKEIFPLDANDGLNFNTPYILSGRFDMSDFPWWCNHDEDALYVSLWARDPFDVPEPISLGLFAIAGLFLVTRRRNN